ncbi:GntR family transcriptional regulator (plasmid) [Streptomyces sp. NBC_00445]|uniref:GntR family transcriptional regulator n=1 Tax=Streptomyces sp. NBC_00445 TaxID=2975745 RepID=UPI002E1AFE84
MNQEVPLATNTTPPEEPQWKRELEGSPSYERRTRLTGSDVEMVRDKFTRSYQAGGTVRGIAGVIGRSYGWVYRALAEAGVLRNRPRRKGCRHSRTAQRDRVTLREQIEAVVRARLADGTYPIGSTIPSLKELSKELRVSTRPVRDALARLQAAGLLLVVTGRGTTVTDPQAPPTGPQHHVDAGDGRSETWTIPRPGVTNADHIRSVIRNRLTNGTYPAGAEIPSAERLANEFNVTECTVRNALKPFREQHLLIVSKQRTFAAPAP